MDAHIEDISFRNAPLVAQVYSGGVQVDSRQDLGRSGVRDTLRMWVTLLYSVALEPLAADVEERLNDCGGTDNNRCSFVHNPAHIANADHRWWTLLEIRSPPQVVDLSLCRVIFSHEELRARLGALSYMAVIDWSLGQRMSGMAAG